MTEQEKIGFYLRTDKYGWMSNFHRARQLIDGFWYQTNEHYYQSMKANQTRVADWIARAPKAYHAMKAGRALREEEMVEDWESKKKEVMLQGLKQKFGQHPDLAEKLLATGDAHLSENSPTDMYWGGALEGSQNMLGNLLMEVRSMLRDEEKKKMSNLITRENTTPIGSHFWNGKEWVYTSVIATEDDIRTAAKNLGYELTKVEATEKTTQPTDP